jgi:hypothetical protein
VPEEHENSVLRDMEVLDKYETLQWSRREFEDVLVAQT